MAGYSARDLYDFAIEVSEGISYVLIPGKYTFDQKVINSDFNQKHNIVGYNPMESLITPFDFTPVGAAVKFNKGYKAFKGGKNMISLGISGFGKRHRNKGVQDMIVSVVSKVYNPFGRPVTSRNKPQFGVTKPTRSEQSRVGPSLTSKPKTRGKKDSRKPLFLTPTSVGGGPACPKGYRLTLTNDGRRICKRK